MAAVPAGTGSTQDLIHENCHWVIEKKGYKILGKILLKKRKLRTNVGVNEKRCTCNDKLDK